MERMKLRNMILRTMLVAGVAAGAVTAYPVAAVAAGTASESVMENHDHIYIRSQQMDYTTEQGQKMTVTVSSNSDETAMVVYYGDKQRAKVEMDENGKYVVTEGELSETVAEKLAETAANNGQWREM